jgi:acetyl esterase/lipase
LFPKLTAGALSPVWAIMGLVGALLGWVYEAYWAVPMGILGAGMMIWYVWRCTRDHQGFEDAFGADWQDQITPIQARHMLKRRWSIYLRMKASPEPIWERDVPFWKIPGKDQQLLCDLWRPGDGHVSGLAFVYCHGGAWAIGDKDILTRPFFHHLVSQGHTVMDVAYRLCPEVDIYGVNPEKIVLGGASAGGHLAQLAGYTPEHPELTPEDLKSADLSVCGVISYYGPTDLVTFYQYMKFKRTVDGPPVHIGLDSTPSKRDLGRDPLFFLLGGWPREVPDMYKLASPITHVHPGCPPTLLIQGNHDVVCSMDATRALYAKLVEVDVPAINVVFPSTAHGFDAALPQINPAAQSALYDVDRFLALMVNKN